MKYAWPGIWRIAVLVGLIGALAGSLPAQAPPPAASQNGRLQAQLKGWLEPVGIQVGQDVVSHQNLPSIDLHFQWNASAAPPATPPPPSEAGYRSPHVMLQRRPQPHGVPVPRALDLAKGHLLVTVLDPRSRLLAWSVIIDPRTIRSEEPGPDGVLRGRLVPVALPACVLNVPDDPNAVEIRLWEPHSADKGTTLSLVAILPAH